MDFPNDNAYPTPLRNLPILPLLLATLATQKNAPETTTVFHKEYDYIVVGAGSAGSVVASRLSEVPCVNVLLLEAGKPPPVLNDIPLLARNFWFTDLDWQYLTVPQKHSGFGLVNRKVIWPSGKGLGGTSLINGMLYVRGNHRNYNDWAEQGAVGWSYSDVKPFFMKLEDNNNTEYIADGYHSVGGPLSVQKPRYDSILRRPLLKSAKLMGLDIVDSNGASQTGYYDHQANHRNGQRCSTAKAYLVPAENRKNLDILTHAFVRKVVIKDNKAMGVEFDHGGRKHFVRAKREVIMSAGTTNTAQLLMLSGIGPRKHLESLNIPVVQELPVGDNMQDHNACPVPFQIDKKFSTALEKALDPLTFLEYYNNRTGILTATEAITLMIFLNGPWNKEPDNPDMQLYFAELPYEYAKAQFGMTPEVYKGAYGPYENSTIFLGLAQILHPKSRGTVRLRSKNPHDPPLIDPNYLEHPDDVRDAVAAIKAIIKIGTSEPMRKALGARRLNAVVPGCENLVGDRYIECMARSIIVTTNHQVGTAKMGDPSDPYTVVDPELRVKNIKGLRVVDASVMPLVPYGNTNIPTIMVAEKGSDIIKREIRCPTQVSPNYNNKIQKPESFLENIGKSLTPLLSPVSNVLHVVGSILDV